MAQKQCRRFQCFAGAALESCGPPSGSAQAGSRSSPETERGVCARSSGFGGLKVLGFKA